MTAWQCFHDIRLPVFKTWNITGKDNWTQAFSGLCLSFGIFIQAENIPLWFWSMGFNNLI